VPQTFGIYMKRKKVVGGCGWADSQVVSMHIGEKD